MKIIKLIGGKEYVLADQEYEVFKQLVKQNKLIELSNGDLVNSSSIAHCGEPDTLPHWQSWPLDREGKYFMRNGSRIYLESHNFAEVEQLPDPKYKTLARVKLRLK